MSVSLSPVPCSCVLYRSVDVFVHVFDAQDVFVCSDAITGHQACIPLLCVVQFVLDHA